MNNIDSIALIGGGPAALFVVKHLMAEKIYPKELYIFEKSENLGSGMPYSHYGANFEHVANVSANELPELPQSFTDFVMKKDLKDYPDFANKAGESMNEYQVIPRLLLGNYLEDQFYHLLKTAGKHGVMIKVFKNTKVVDIDRKNDDFFTVITESGDAHNVSKVIICTGHQWSSENETRSKGWYDSPYPPSKFNIASNHSVAIRGTSLTAVDAVKTLARLNGKYVEENGGLKYLINEENKNFSITLFSKRGFLPALRFHSEGSPYSEGWIMSHDEIYEYKQKNNGFVDLDYVFNLNFKEPLRKKNEKFYQEIKDLTIEEFVEKMLELREKLDSFQLFRAEFAEAEKSIERHQTIAWKETLSAFSYAINYPAKHFSAEDMMRLRKTLLPLISVIIASLPQSSYKELIALYDAGILHLVSVNENSRIESHEEEGIIYHYTDEAGAEKSDHYKLYIDAIGQQPVQFNDIPFEGLKNGRLISSGYIKFKDPEKGKSEFERDSSHIMKTEPDNYYLRVDGLNINDHFQALDYYGKATEDLYIMAVPYIAGLNPDYSGLDFCDTAGKRIVQSLV
ncbi:FAD/NAD(P)-binding protein [uncultured Chryseobacterium sp.]|uniref:FAD/NAD(P)-binding protein n=1 Tax=uncultured Chryseobacterium sp. TaxID=259322 RepID=UPI00258686BC|nr:FAD/NAD(P)-binding protein [uncultured Chryseobacterium sp.]